MAELNDRLWTLERRRSRWEAGLARARSALGRRFEAERRLAAGLGDLWKVAEGVAGLAMRYLGGEGQGWVEALRAGLHGEARGGSGAAVGRLLGEWLRRGTPTPEASREAFEVFEALTDRTLRRHCFALAMRYWEGRWLPEADRSEPDPRLPGVVAELRRHAMVAPVIVGTAFTLPRALACLRADGGFGHCLSAADLLIVDEAGQVPPQAAAALFGLARRAVVVGDVEQLKPIWGISSADDEAILYRHGLGRRAMELDQWGSRAASGSVMRLARRASAFGHPDGRGIPLVRHYRCRPSIIEFCNELVYHRTEPLIPVTGEHPSPLYPPMAYVPCVHPARASGGSLENPGEALEIVAWLRAERERIEAFYNRRDDRPIAPGHAGYRDLGDLVSIVTPYAAQKVQLRRLVRQHFPEGPGDSPPGEDRGDGTVEGEDGGGDPRRPLCERMVIGTVHALQGAEKEIVLFSAVSSPTDGRAPFVDAGTDMLNVAVSRARDTFAFFGHHQVFFSVEARDSAPTSPSAVLARYLGRRGRRLYPQRLMVVESGAKAAAIQDWVGPATQVSASLGHLRQLRGVEFPEGLPEWELSASRRPWLEGLVRDLEDVKELVIATDDDREGDAIGMHLVDELRQRGALDGVTVSRAVYGEVTREAVEAGLAARTPGWAGSLRGRAAVTRAVIDFAIGASVSEYLQMVGPAHGLQGRLDTGRVQAANLQLLADAADRPPAPPPWCLRARLRVGGAELSAWLAKDRGPHGFESEADALAAAQALERASASPASAATRFLSLGASPPTSTARILALAHEELGLSPDRTMDILQDLYQGRRAPDAVEREDG